MTRKWAEVEKEVMGDVASYLLDERRARDAKEAKRWTKGLRAIRTQKKEERIEKKNRNLKIRKRHKTLELGGMPKKDIVGQLSREFSPLSASQIRRILKKK